MWYDCSCTSPSIDEAHALLVLISTADFQSARFGINPKKSNQPNHCINAKFPPSNPLNHYRILSPTNQHLQWKIKPLWMRIWPHRLSTTPILNKIFLNRNHLPTIWPWSRPTPPPPLSTANKHPLPSYPHSTGSNHHPITGTSIWMFSKGIRMKWIWCLV
jgi:hypothetical protein